MAHFVIAIAGPCSTTTPSTILALPWSCQLLVCVLVALSSTTMSTRSLSRPFPTPHPSSLLIVCASVFMLKVSFPSIQRPHIRVVEGLSWWWMAFDKGLLLLTAFNVVLLLLMTTSLRHDDDDVVVVVASSQSS